MGAARWYQNLERIDVAERGERGWVERGEGIVLEGQEPLVGEKCVCRAQRDASRYRKFSRSEKASGEIDAMRFECRYSSSVCSG